jgi:hypothetical protein
LREQVRRQKGKGRKKQRRRGWKAEWREPKKFVIYELDEQGRMKAGTRAFMDGTLQGPDALMELLAMRLYQLGANQAQEIVFVADGGTWIWNRWQEVIRLLKLDATQVSKVLDFCHAAQHIQIALKALSFSDKARRAIYHRQRRQLLRGRADLTIKELKQYAKECATDKKVLAREIKYFEKHSSHMDYKRLREAGKPMGSGAIESAIRRVLNQRLKGNGIMWNEDNAEAIMVLRGLVLSDRWDQALKNVRATMAIDRGIDWRWHSPDMRTEPEADESDEASALILFTPPRVRHKRA